MQSDDVSSYDVASRKDLHSFGLKGPLVDTWLGPNVEFLVPNSEGACCAAPHGTPGHGKCHFGFDALWTEIKSLFYMHDFLNLWGSKEANLFIL